MESTLTVSDSAKVAAFLRDAAPHVERMVGCARQLQALGAESCAGESLSLRGSMDRAQDQYLAELNAVIGMFQPVRTLFAKPEAMDAGQRAAFETLNTRFVQARQCVNALLLIG